MTICFLYLVKLVNLGECRITNVDDISDLKIVILFDFTIVEITVWENKEIDYFLGRFGDKCERLD